MFADPTALPVTGLLQYSLQLQNYKNYFYYNNI